MTLGALSERLNRGGFGLLVIFLCLPFLQPVPLGGLSTAVGPLIVLLGIRMARGSRELSLPAWIARRRIDEKTLRMLLGAARSFYSFAETLVRPRWKTFPSGERAAGPGIALSAALLTLPFPIPLSNMICAGPIALLALAAVEEDGLLALAGWLALLFTIAFHVCVALLGIEGVRALLRAL